MNKDLWKEICRKLYQWYQSRINPYEEFTPTEWGREIANLGERLVPGIAGWPEIVRHKSSYYFFKKIIAADQKNLGDKKLEIIDLGCGVGHGTKILAGLKNTQVTGIDNCQETIDYAKNKFSAKNIKYQVKNLVSFIPKMPVYDYAVSRGVFEHLPNGLKLVFKSRWRNRLIFDVPYNEPSKNNPYHLITKITEKDFQNISNAELFYEDLAGNVYAPDQKPEHANLIVCVVSHPKLKKVKEIIKFPVFGWRGQKPRWIP